MSLSGSMSNFALHTLYSAEQRSEHNLQINSGYIEAYFLSSTEDLTFIQKTNHLNFPQWYKNRQTPLKLTGLPNVLKQPQSKNAKMVNVSSLLSAVTYDHFAREVTND